MSPEHMAKGLPGRRAGDDDGEGEMRVRGEIDGGFIKDKG